MGHLYVSRSMLDFKTGAETQEGMLKAGIACCTEKNADRRKGVIASVSSCHRNTINPDTWKGLQ